ncbi:hypothetical protein GLAREA_10808 [Glarea lozoyensis ATCC 20868]|uniref:SMODS and SLOG-associating 2TM effector domain-containing protein n=1 Tax=Glarea lozoyensis (strain ATCC 20868 / MF5171) TaxID=1116229 RepID=S3D9F2_GLAL2|nr:uncharacterized protein GLAREA_10808 [Glarea lozoyensis ATCC 20868]EPE35112.1 hypothetical protein GLAREA_10808 [Glarea lozoyensis ATCC 20868]
MGDQTLGSKPTAPSFRSGSPTPEQLTTLGHAHILRRLSDADLTMVIHAIGGSHSTESQNVAHPTSWLYPPKGLPDGLYRDVIRARVGRQYMYYAFSMFFNASMITQLILGALLTALGARAKSNETLITVLAAANTIVAGLLALMHNSGLPNRYQNDWYEFDKVEAYIRELMNTGIVLKDQTRDEVVETCYSIFRKAKDTIAKNQPASYTATEGGAAPVGSSQAPHS